MGKRFLVYFPDLLKDGFGLFWAFFVARLGPCVWGAGVSFAPVQFPAGPQSSPILVEDTHAAVGVFEISIIIHGQSRSGIENRIERAEIRNAGSTSEINAAGIANDFTNYLYLPPKLKATPEQLKVARSTDCGL